MRLPVPPRLAMKINRLAEVELSRLMVTVAPLATVTVLAILGAVPKALAPESIVNVPLPLRVVEPVLFMRPPVQFRPLRVNVLEPFKVPAENV